MGNTPFDGESTSKSELNDFKAHSKEEWVLHPWLLKEFDSEIEARKRCELIEKKKIVWPSYYHSEIECMLGDLLRVDQVPYRNCFSNSFRGEMRELYLLQAEEPQRKVFHNNLYWM